VFRPPLIWGEQINTDREQGKDYVESVAMVRISSAGPRSALM